MNGYNSGAWASGQGGGGSSNTVHHNGSGGSSNTVHHNGSGGSANTGGGGGQGGGRGSSNTVHHDADAGWCCTLTQQAGEIWVTCAPLLIRVRTGQPAELVAGGWPVTFDGHLMTIEGANRTVRYWVRDIEPGLTSESDYIMELAGGNPGAVYLAIRHVSPESAAAS